ncbi:MAG: CPXCG motif-containing cysteine-rich protein [Acidobacteria bacterium]|nr:MAG: CPXCG motif-containing cysteine-rich protein [Acidobacteriota bacterium]
MRDRSGDGEDGGDGASSTTFAVTCPYCGEPGEIYIEPDVIGTLVQDCEVCCNPWQVRVGYDDGERYVEVTRGDGSD